MYVLIMLQQLYTIYYS